MVLLIIVFHQLILSRLATVFEISPQSSLIRRAVFWKGAIHAFLAAPVLGQGFGTFQIFLPHFRSANYWMLQSEDIVPHAHNEYLEILSETGVAGFIAFIAIVVLYFREAIRIYRVSNQEEKTILASLIIGMIGVLIDNLANESLRAISILLFFCIVLGTTILFNKHHLRMVSKRLSPSVRQFQVLPLIVSVVLLIPFFNYEINTIKADRLAFKGAALERQNQPAIAIRTYEEALLYDENKTFALFQAGGKYFDMGSYAKAIPYLERLKILSPYYPKMNMLLGLCYFNTGQTAKGIEAAKEELAISSHPQNYYILSIFYQRSGNTFEEMQTIEKMLRISIEGNNKEFIGYGLDRLTLLYTQINNWQRAFPLYQDINDKFDDDIIVWKNVAIAYEMNGKIEQAKKLYQKVLEQNPSDSTAHQRLSKLQGNTL